MQGFTSTVRVLLLKGADKWNLNCIYGNGEEDRSKRQLFGVTALQAEAFQFHQSDNVKGPNPKMPASNPFDPDPNSVPVTDGNALQSENGPFSSVFSWESVFIRFN